MSCPKCVSILRTHGADIDMKALIAQARREGSAKLCADCRTRGADPSTDSGVTLAGLTALLQGAAPLASSAATITGNLANPNLGANAAAIGGAIQTGAGAIGGAAQAPVAAAAADAKDLLWEAGGIAILVFVVVIIVWRVSTRSH